MQPPKHTRSCSLIHVFVSGDRERYGARRGRDELRHRRAGQLNCSGVFFREWASREHRGQWTLVGRRDSSKQRTAAVGGYHKTVSSWLGGAGQFDGAEWGASSQRARALAHGRGRGGEHAHDRGHFFVAPCPLEVFTAAGARDYSLNRGSKSRCSARRLAQLHLHAVKVTPPLKQFRRASRVPTGVRRDLGLRLR